MDDWLSMGLDIFKGLTTARAQRAVGNAQDEEAKFVAKQMEINAGTAQAIGQREAAEEMRQAKLVQSRIMAVAAASGGGASDPSVMNMISSQAGEGAYRAALAIYRGDDKARDLNMAAMAKRYEGEAAKSAGKTRAIGTLIGTASTLFSKYGQAAPVESAAESAIDPYPELDAWGTGEFK